MPLGLFTEPISIRSKSGYTMVSYQVEVFIKLSFLKRSVVWVNFNDLCQVPWYFLYMLVNTSFDVEFLFAGVKKTKSRIAGNSFMCVELTVPKAKANQFLEMCESQLIVLIVTNSGELHELERASFSQTGPFS